MTLKLYFYFFFIVLTIILFAYQTNYINQSQTNYINQSLNLKESAFFIQKYYCSRLSTLDLITQNQRLFNQSISLNLPSSGPIAFDMFIYQSDDIVSDSIKANGAWEMGITEAIDAKMHSFAMKNRLEHDQVTFVDIGANIGWFSTVYANAGYKVISFEPMPANEIVLRQNQCLFYAKHTATSRWTYYNIGLGEKRDSCKMISHSTNLGDGHTKCGPSITIDPGYILRASIDIYPLDYVIEIDGRHRDLRIGAVKMDVESFEKFVILGGIKFFKKIEFLVVELMMNGSPESLERSGFVYSKLTELGFTMSNKDGGVPFSKEEALSKSDVIAYRT